MKCEMHPNLDAVGNCVYCGRGVCEQCKVRINDIVHCKECVEAGRVRGGPQQTQAAPGPPGVPPGMGGYPTMYPGYGPMAFPSAIYLVPKPPGKPSRAFFHLGAMSSLICMILSFATGMTMMWSIFFSYEMSGVRPETFFTILYVLGFALLPLIISYYGFYQNYGSKAAWVGIIGFFFTIPFFYFTWGYYLNIEVNNGGDSASNTFELVVTSIIILGAALMFATVPLRNFAHYIPPFTDGRRMMVVAMGMMAAASISFLCFFGVYVFGWFLLGIAMFFMFLAFRKAPLPDSQAQGPPPLNVLQKMPPSGPGTHT